MNIDAENLERAALKDLHLAATEVERERLALRALERGSVLASIAPRLPASAIVINRALGLGLGLGLSAPESRDGVRDLVDTYRDAGVARFFLQDPPMAAPRELSDWLEEAGLQRARGWQKFSRGRESVVSPATDLDVREVGMEYGEAFARIACDGFDLGEAARPWLARLPGQDNWHVFMSFSHGEPVGAGAMFVQESLAWMDFAATRPAYRRRGSQAALLAARVQRALALDCRRMFACTGVQVPGDPQHSYRDILKAGFKEDYIRDNYAPPR